MRVKTFFPFLFLLVPVLAGCTVKAVGDPNRPITIKADITIDIRGLKKTAVGIEDMVAEGTSPNV